MRAFSCTLGEEVFPPSTSSPFLYIMQFDDQEFEFREPFDEDENGFYITIAQANFWLNGQDTKLDPFSSGEFLDYYRKCCFYNFVYDRLEEDPTCGMMFWDPKKECISLAFPTDGIIARTLDEHNPMDKNG